MVCGFFHLYHENYNFIPHLKLSEMNKSVKSLKILGSYIDSFFSGEKLGMETTSNKKAPNKEEKSWVYFKFCVRFSLVSLEGGCLFIISPITSPTGSLVVSAGHAKLNLIVFFTLSVFIKIEQACGINELYIISHVWKQCQFFIICHHKHLWPTFSKYPLQRAGFQIILIDLKLLRHCFLFSCQNCQIYTLDLPHLFSILHILWSAKLVLPFFFFPVDDKCAILEVLGYSTPSSHLQLKYWL